MKTISILQRIFIYSFFGMLSVLMVGFAISGRLEAEQILSEPASYIGFIVPALLSLFLTKKI